MKRYMLLIVMIFMGNISVPRAGLKLELDCDKYLKSAPELIIQDVAIKCLNVNQTPQCWKKGILQDCDGFWGWERLNADPIKVSIEKNKNADGCVDYTGVPMMCDPPGTYDSETAYGALHISTDTARGVVYGDSSLPALIDTTGKLIVTIDKQNNDALLECGSVHHNWIDGPELTYILKPGEWKDVDGIIRSKTPVQFQHCKVCGVLRIKPEGAK
jgi:hypothetical protein